MRRICISSDLTSESQELVDAPELISTRMIEASTAHPFNEKKLNAQVQVRELIEGVVAARNASPHGWAALLLWQPSLEKFIGVSTKINTWKSQVWQLFQDPQGNSRQHPKNAGDETRGSIRGIPIAIVRKTASGLYIQWLTDASSGRDFLGNAHLQKKLVDCMNILLHQRAKQRSDGSEVEQ